MNTIEGRSGDDSQMRRTTLAIREPRNLFREANRPATPPDCRAGRVDARATGFASHAIAFDVTLAANDYCDEPSAF
jgi:hypothetical protein